MSEKWDHRFLNLAGHISYWSYDPSTKIGAVIVDKDKRIVSVGYNGFPKGIKDDKRLEDRELKYKIIIHGEMNAMHFANRDLNGCTIYTLPFMPCSTCAAHIIQRGITRVVSCEYENPRWDENLKISKSLLSEAGIELVLYPRTANLGFV